MRTLLLSLALSLTAASAAADTQDARAMFVERRGLIEADAACRLFTPSVRDALSIGVAQARGALLRAGWSNAQVRDLEGAVVSAARARTCTDTRTTEAANAARRGFGAWANSGTMSFPGWERTWVARRSTGGDSWRLSQAIDTPIRATFGIRDRDGAQRLVLILSPTETSAASLQMRDTPRAALVEVGLNQRVAGGLRAGAPSLASRKTFEASRSVERSWGRPTALVFTFPDEAFRDLLSLDPRESVEITLRNGRSTQSIFVEVGDVAAARAFLTMRR
jgi:hypothetical protein